MKKEILKYFYNHEEAKSGLKKARTNENLFELLSPPSEVDMSHVLIEDGLVGTAEAEDVTNIALPPLLPCEDGLDETAETEGAC